MLRRRRRNRCTLTSTPVQKFNDVLSCGDSGFVELRGGPASHEAVQISARELSLEGLGELLVVFLDADDTGGDGVLGREVGRSERFALEDGEVDLDLVDPAGVLGQMYEGEARMEIFLTTLPKSWAQCTSQAAM